MSTTPGSNSEIVEDRIEEATKLQGVDKEKETGEDIANGQLDWLDEVPDGGFAAWLVVLGAWCCSFVSFGWINSIGVFQEYYERVPLRSYSSSTIAWIPSLQLFFMMFCGPAVGILFDKYGPRYIILGGTFFHVFGLMMASISDQYYQLLLSQGVCSAIGVAAIFQPGLACIMGWFSKKRGIAYGIMATGSSIGGVIFPIMVNRLIKEVGYGWAMRISAFMILALLVIANLTVKARRPPGRVVLTRNQMAESFRDFPFLILAFGIALLTFGIYVPVVYLPAEGIAVGGLSINLSQYIVSIFNAASLFGRLIAGLASDKFGKYNVFLVCCYISGIITLALWIPSNKQGATVAFAALYGCFSGAYVSLIGALVAQISVPREIGYRTGLVFLGGSIPSLTSNPIAGAIQAHAGGWVDVKVYAGVLILAGTAFITVTRIAHVGWKLTAVF